MSVTLRQPLGSHIEAWRRTRHFRSRDEGYESGVLSGGLWTWQDGTGHDWLNGSQAAWTINTQNMAWGDGQTILWGDNTPICWGTSVSVGDAPAPPAEPDRSPAPFAFNTLNNLPLNQPFSSVEITVQGVDGTENLGGQQVPLGIPISVSGTASGAAYTVNDGPPTSSPGFVYLVDRVRAYGFSSGSSATSVYVDVLIFDKSGRFTLNTATPPPPDVTPNAYDFVDVPAAVLSTVYSDIQPISGIDGPAPVEMVLSHSASAGRFRIVSGGVPGAWFQGVTVAGSGPTATIINGQSIEVEMTSSATNTVTHTATVTVGTGSANWLVTTEDAPAPDTLPDAIDFGPPLTDVAVSTLQTSPPVTVLGTNAPTLAEVSGDASSLMSINGGTPTATPTFVNNGDQIVVTHMSSASFSTQVDTVLELDNGNVSDTFSSVTAASPGSGAFTPLAAPSWLIDAGYAEDYAYTKCGYDYIKASYQTRFKWDFDGIGTVSACSTQAQLDAAIAAAKTDSTIKGIHLSPGDYQLAINQLSGLNHTPEECFFIRTTPGSASQARFTNQPQVNNGNLTGFALVDVELAVGFRLVRVVSSAGGAIYKDILIERCKGFAVVEGQRISGGTGAGAWGLPAENIQLRLNDFSDHWGAPGNNLTHGFFGANIDGLLIEAGIYDHNGWNPAGDRSTPESSGGPNGRKHNIYISRPSGYDLSIAQPPVVRFNYISRASSHGTHMKGGAHVYGNIYSNCPIAHQNAYGMNDGQGTLFSFYGVADDSTFYDNLILGSDDIRTSGPSQPMGVGVWCTCCSNALIDNNYFLYDRTSATNGSTVRIERDFPTDVAITNNWSISWNGNIVQLGSPNYVPTIVDSGNDWAASITPEAQALAYQLGADPVMANVTAWIANYRASRARKGVDIIELQTWMADIRAGITP